MPHHVRLDPKNANKIGPPSPDSSILPEFTFHHGHVDKVYNTQMDKSGTIKASNGFPGNISQTIAVTPTFEGVVNSSYIQNQIICQPLLRGFSDSIATGDSVIYTQIGDIFYYLGPLNTTNNPNYTPDQFRNSIQNEVVVDERKFDPNGYNINYISRVINKATKNKSLTLDRPFNSGIGNIGTDAELESTYSDLTLEGRQGNSIQIGARFVNPHIIINNNTSVKNNGSVFGMLSFGNPLENHIVFDELSSDKVVDKAIADKESYIGNYIGVGNDSTEGEGIVRQDKFNKKFGSPVGDNPDAQLDFDQIIMFSDRITFDAQNNDLTMSALRNINVGSGQNVSITSKKHTLIESENIYLGKNAKNKSEPMVLGNQLRNILVRILKILDSARANVQGVPLPLVGGTDITNTLNAKPTDDIPTLLRELEGLDTQAGEGDSKFFSQHHYIEQNDRSQNNEG